MSTNQLYHTLFQRVRQLWPKVRVTQRRNLVWLMVGLYQSKSVHLNQIALKIPGTAVLVSVERRLARFLSNRQVAALRWYEPVARQWLQQAAQTTGELRLIIDGTKIGFGFQLVLIALAFRRRAIPITWTWLRYGKGHSSAEQQVALVKRVQRLVPAATRVVVVGDTEFESGTLQHCLTEWGWHYALRQKPNNLVQVPGTTSWQPFGRLVLRPGQTRWLTQARVTAKHSLTVNLLAYWKWGEPTPWLLATNLPTRTQTLRAYRRRMWIEELFGDLKKHGFDLESTHLRQVGRLSRLTLAVVLLYDWLMLVGTQSIKAGHRSVVDRHDRKDLSVFQIGLRLIERWLVNLQPFSIAFGPKTPKLSGS
jgi:hypothetical protein